MVDRINQSNAADLVKDLLNAEKRAEEDVARRVQLEAASQAQTDLQAAEIAAEDLQVDDVAAQASAQQDRGAEWAAFSADETSAAKKETDQENSEAEKVNVQDLLNQMKIESGKISS